MGKLNITETSIPGVSFHSLGEGKTGELIKAHDWSKTSLGPIESWSKSLLSHVKMVLALPTPAIIFWGKEQVQIYNDGYAVIMGPRHPKHLGSTFKECWPEAYPLIDPWMKRVTENAEVVVVQKSPIELTRHGFIEECYFTFTFSPLRDDDGKIAGLLQLVTEVTDLTLAERRTETLRRLTSSSSLNPLNIEDLSQVLADNSKDIRFALFFSPNSTSGELTLSSYFGMNKDTLTGPNSEQFLKSIRQAFVENTSVEIQDIQKLIPHSPIGAWPEPTQNAIAFSIQGIDVASSKGVIVFGLSPRLKFDERYKNFLQNIVREVTFGIISKKTLLEKQIFVLAETIPQLCWIAHADGYVFWYNQNWFTYTGTQLDEMKGWGWQSVHDPKTLSSVVKRWKTSIDTGQPFEMKFPLRGANGKYRWFLTRTLPLRDSQNNIINWFGTNTDIEELRISEMKFASIYEKSPIAISLLETPTGKFTDINTAWSRLFGYSKEEAVGKDAVELGLIENSLELEQVIHQAMSKGSIVDQETIAFTKAKEPRNISYSVECIEFGEKQFLLASILDLTEKKLAQENALQSAANEKAAKETGRLKSEFLATMSHEIRTPINGIIGMTGILLETHLDEKQKDYTDTVRRSADTLLAVINDILDFSKVEADKLKIENEDFDLIQVIDDTTQTLRFAIKQKNLSIKVDVQKMSSTLFRGDSGRIRQILTNLLSNAVKFTAEGQIVLRVFQESTNHTRSQLRFEVQDSGIGIPESALGKMFQAFSQVDSTTTRRFGGTGLGLSISKKLVELMGGTIHVESKENQGSKFWFTLPLEFSSIPHLAVSKNLERPKPELRSLRILIAEDHPINQKVALLQIEGLGYRGLAVANGREALAALKEIPYDLILMDCQMPELDGFETTQIIRTSDSVPNKNIPIIAMTANAMGGDREKCIRSGMTDYVSKPVKISELSEVIERVFKASCYSKKG